MQKETPRVCKNGHKFFKSSDCPVCPICEKRSVPKDGLLFDLSAPARRALESVRITSLQQLSKHSQAELLNLHGFGPSSIVKLEKILHQNGLSFAKD